MVLSIDKSNLPNCIFTLYGRTVTVRMLYRDRLKHQKIRPYAYGQQPLRYGAQPYLKDPDFDISHWYAEQRMKALGLTETIRHHHCIGDAVATVAAKLLTDGIPSLYPCTDQWLNADGRFLVKPSATNLGDYAIRDMDLELEIAIPKMWLEDPEFDLVSWYRQYLDEFGIFEQRYYEAHRELSLQSWKSVNQKCECCSPGTGILACTVACTHVQDTLAWHTTLHMKHASSF